MTKPIQQNNWLYNLLCPLVQFATRCHYNRFVVRGIENLPTDGPYIIAPCHQQTLMEPLAVLCFSPKPPVFLARADIFARPTIRAILTFLRILPVYRIRDGQENLGRNQDIFDQCRDVLLDDYPLCLMAEGRHNNRHHLLPLRKGMFRIAGETQLALGDRPLYIVPTGIDFDHYERPYSNLVVNIGSPIPVQPFMDTYRDNPPLALNQMRDALTDALIPLMLHIRNQEYYDEIFSICNLMNSKMRRKEGLKNNAWNRFLIRQRIADKMDSLMENQQVDESLRQRVQSTLPLDPALLSDHWSLPTTLFALLSIASLITLVVLFPPLRLTLLFCLLCYPLPFLPTHLIPRKIIKDPQFRSAINFGIRFVLSILYALVISVVMACCHGAWMNDLIPIGPWWGLVALVIVIVFARLAAPIVNILRSTLHNTCYWLRRSSGRLRDINSLVQQISQLLTHNS